jgi:hypothetical protein
MSEMFLMLTFVCIAWGIVSMIAITSFLQKRGTKINYILLNIMMFKYVHDYHQITIKEDGKPGFWFYSFTFAMNMALFCAIIALIMN